MMAWQTNTPQPMPPETVGIVIAWSVLAFVAICLIIGWLKPRG